MIVVCDSSPLVALAMCDCLALLDALFTEVMIPQCVYDEISINDKPESAKITDWTRGKVVKTENARLAEAFNLILDAGEAEALTLYWEKAADFLLIDEKKGRKIAAISGMNITGTMGVLLMAKRKGLIPFLTPLIKTLKKSSVRISNHLYETALRLAGE